MLIKLMPRLSLHSSLLFITQSGTALQSRRGSLCARRADGSESLYPPRMHGLRTIILAGHGASITSEAMRWCAREGVACFLMERSGEAIAVLTSSVETDGRRKSLHRRQQQFAAILDPRKRSEIARKIARAKLATLGLHPADAREFRKELSEARKLDDILTCEARAGAAFFMRWRGTEMVFRDEVPVHWRIFTARAGSFLPGKRGTSKARYAAAPIPAMLNYAYAVALGQCTRAVIGAGLDACHGFLHSPKPGRLSLSYDVLEGKKAAITEAVFGYVTRRPFKRDDFEQDIHGIVRLSASIALEVAALALITAPMAECVKSVGKMTRLF